MTFPIKIKLNSWGNTEAKIFFVTACPTVEDLKSNCLYSQDSQYAKEIFSMLDRLGKNEDSVWFTSLVKCGTGAKKPTAEMYAEGLRELKQEIQQYKPKLIVCFGADVFKTIMQKPLKISNFYGVVMDSPVGKILPTYSPANIYGADPKLRPLFTFHLQTAFSYVDGTYNKKDFKWIVVDDPAQNTQIINHYIENKKFNVGYDAEWKGVWKKNEVLYTFQYSCEPDKAVVLDISKDGQTENLALLDTMKPLLEHPECRRMGWNIRADDKRLTERGFKLPEQTLAFDGMKAVAFFDSRLPKGLETGINLFTSYYPYYGDFYLAMKKHGIATENLSEMKFKEPDLFYRYCAGDAVAHYSACMNMISAMNNPKHVSPELKKYYYEVYLPLTNYMMDMELTGLPIDVECLDEMTGLYSSCFNLLFNKLKEMVKKYGFDSEQYNVLLELHGKKEGAKIAKEQGITVDFNPNAVAHKKKLFFDAMKLDPPYYVQRTKTRPRDWFNGKPDSVKAKFSPSTNSKAISSLRFELLEQLKKEKSSDVIKELEDKTEILTTYLDLARVGVFANKFLSKVGVDAQEDSSEHPEQDSEEISTPDVEEVSDLDYNDTPLKSSYWAALRQGNRIHADFFECLNNYRSSSRVNVQNPASKVLSYIPNIFQKYNLETPRNIRHIFYSGHKDWYFAEVDVAGADLAIAAFLSKDKSYIYDIRKGNFHLTKMREYFQNPELTKEDSSKYVTSKAITFRVAYTSNLQSAALPIQAEIFAESGNHIDINTLLFALNTWKRYDTYMSYREDCMAQVDNLWCIKNARGFKYLYEETEEFGIKAGWYNQSLAFPIASELALFMWDVAVSLKRKFVADNTWMKWIYPCNTVHDAHYWLVHKDMLKDNYFQETCKNIFTKDVKIATGDNLGIEMIISDRWKGENKVFQKETTWDFATSSWVW